MAFPHEGKQEISENRLSLTRENQKMAKTSFPAWGKTKNQRKSAFPHGGKQEIGKNRLSAAGENQKISKNWLSRTRKSQKMLKIIRRS